MYVFKFTLYLASSQAQQSGTDREVSSQMRFVSCPSSANQRLAFSYTIALKYDQMMYYILQLYIKKTLSSEPEYL